MLSSASLPIIMYPANSKIIYMQFTSTTLVQHPQVLRINFRGPMTKANMFCHLGISNLSLCDAIRVVWLTAKAFCFSCGQSLLPSWLLTCLLYVTSHRAIGVHFRPYVSQQCNLSNRFFLLAILIGSCSTV